MFTFLRPIMLPNAESYTLKTNLSKQDAITNIQEFTLKNRILIFSGLFSIFGTFPFKSSKFSGKVNESGFDITLVYLGRGSFIPLFCPPKIQAFFEGDDPVQINVSISNTKYEKVFLLVFSGFALFWLFSWILAMPIGLTYGYWEHSRTNDVPSPLSVNFVEIINLSAIYFVPITLVPLFFIIGPRYLTIRSRERSKELLLEIFDIE